METPKKNKRQFDDGISTPSPKRARKELSIEDKMNLIHESEKIPKISQKDLSLKFGIGKSTVCDILKRKDEYRQQYEENFGSKRKRHVNTGKYSDLNELLYRWFKSAREKNIPISGPIIQEKALSFAAEMNLTEFKASNGWLESWRSRFSIGFFQVCGESSDVDMDVVNDFKKKLPDIVKNYATTEIFNADETGLFYRALPDKTLSKKGDECKGGKLAKERITVMLCCSASGEKLKPLVIGKANHPRCFRNLNPKSLPVTWKANKKAWMTNAIFIDWAKDINKQMRKKSRNIVIFVDNATSHAQNLKLSNVEVKFFPANCTSKLQPLDLGIIRAFKARYRKYLLKHLLTKIDSSNSASQLCKEINVLKAIHWIAKSWNETKQTTIESCFKNAGFPVCASVTEGAELNDDPEDDIPLSQLVDRDDEIPLMDLMKQLKSRDSEVNVENIDLDDNLPTENTFDTDWEEDLLSEFKKNESDVLIESDSSDDESENLPGSDLTHKQLLEHLNIIKNFATANDDRYLGGIEQMISLTEEEIVRQKVVTAKQANIDTFFKPIV